MSASLTRRSFADRIRGARILDARVGLPLRWPLGRSPELLAGLEDAWAVRRLQWFTHGFYAVSREGDALVITDLRMAPSNGLELIRQVRESTRAALPIIIMSGDAEAPDVIDAMHLSVVDFLLKPIDSVKLAKLVKRELGMAS